MITNWVKRKPPATFAKTRVTKFNKKVASTKLVTFSFKLNYRLPYKIIIIVMLQNGSVASNRF